MRLRRGPHREGPLDLGYGRIRPVSKQLMDIREGDCVCRTSSTRVEAVPLCAEGAERLLLEVLSDRFQVDECGNSEGSKDRRIADARQLQEGRSLDMPVLRR